MQKAAKALVIKSDPTGHISNNDILKPLSKINRFGIATNVIHAGKNVDFSDINTLPDVIILDTEGVESSPAMADYSRKMRTRSLSSTIPVAVIGLPSGFQNYDVDLHLDYRLPANVLSKKLKHLIRLSAMKSEYSRRLKTAEEFGIKATRPNPKPEAIRILVVGKGERYFQLARVFDREAIHKATATFEEARNILDQSPFDCLIIDTLETQDFSLEKLKDFKLSSQHFHLPVIVLQEGVSKDEHADIMASGFCDLFDLHDEADEIAIHTHSVVEMEKLRQNLIDAFKSDDFQEIYNPASGLPDKVFFERHLDFLLQQSKAWNRTIAFGVFQITPVFETTTTSDEHHKTNLLRQVGQTISTLIRVEDIATYLDDDRFVIATPNTTGLAISVLIGRIAAVLRMTEFSAGGIIGKIDVDTHYWETTPDANIQSVLKKITMM